MSQRAATAVDRWYDEQFVVETLQALAGTPADVPLGQNEIETKRPGELMLSKRSIEMKPSKFFTSSLSAAAKHDPSAWPT